MENKQQTPLQRLIAQLEDRIEFCLDGGCDTNQTEIDTLDIVIMTAKQLLPYEREVIENAFEDGVENEYECHINNQPRISSLQFYTQTFQTNE